MMEQATLLNFPCAYPIKIMGNNSDDFAAAVQIICEKYVCPDQIHYSRRLSSGDKYLSITATCIVQSKKQLDQIYQELKSQKLVLFAL